MQRRALEDKLAVQKEELAEIDELKAALEAKLKPEAATVVAAERPGQSKHTPGHSAMLDALDEMIASMEADRSSLMSRHYDDPETASMAAKVAEDAENSIRAMKAQPSMIKALEQTPK